MRFSPRPALLAFSAGTLLFTACASGSDAASTDTLVPVVTISDVVSDAADFNEADVAFAQSMIPHHREAVEMAEMALAPQAEAGAEIRALATQIQGAQDPEIEQMTNLLESWGAPVDMTGMEGMDDMEGMEDTMSAEEMASLSAMSGSDFDSVWALQMIEHHEGAVSMAQEVKASGSNAEVLALADAIIAGQQVEIDQMNAFTGS